MQLETFRGQELRALIRQVSRTMGDDAMILRTKVLQRPSGDVVEVVAARAAQVEAFQRKIDGGRAAAKRTNSRQRVGPYVIALVGPAGAGKTTSAVKLALNDRGVGKKRVGLITLDTYRVGGVEEVQTFAEIAQLPVEIVYHAREVPAALHRLRDRDVVIVDTPGRAMEGTDWPEALATLDPDEVHLVLPAGLRIDVARSLQEGLAATQITHVLFTKLDEVPNDCGLAELADAVGLPARWVGDGPEVPAALAPASPRILGSLGLAVDTQRRKAV